MGESGAGQPGVPTHAPARGAWIQPAAPLCPFRKVVRRASLSDRTNLYRKEYEGEAILWQQRSASEDQRTSAYNGDIRETRADQENKDPVSGPVSALGGGQGPSLVWPLHRSAFRRRLAGEGP